MALATLTSCGGGSPSSAPKSFNHRQALKAAAEGRPEFTWVVEFRDQADLRRAAQIRDWKERGDAILRELVATAVRSQAPARRIMRKAGVEGDTFWIGNAIVIHSPGEEMGAWLRKLPGVREVEQEAVPNPVRPGRFAESTPSGTGGNLLDVRAPAVWRQGITGEGVTIGSIDTGAQYDHPALVDRYRGNTSGNPRGPFNHNYNWWNSLTEACGREPCDLASHGTHTVGTMIGRTQSSRGTIDIGAAPGARWIAAVGCTADKCQLDDLLASLQFMLAPTNLNYENPRPELRPHILNNSWLRYEGDAVLDRAVQALTAAGILTVFAAGNEGPACGSAGSPGDGPLAVSVGAVDKSGAIYARSGRGPTRGDVVNPDLVAPGTEIESSVPKNTYATATGTSMASPLVTGGAALMMQANRELIGRPGEVVKILWRSARPKRDEQCGVDPNDRKANNVYGDGILDLPRAVKLAKKFKPRGPSATR